MVITKNPLLHIKLGSTDITANRIELDVEGFRFEPADRNLVSTGTLSAPQNSSGKRAEQRSIYPATDFGTKYPMPITMRLNLTECFIRTIRDTHLLFEDLKADTPYAFKCVRSTKTVCPNGQRFR